MFRSRPLRFILPVNHNNTSENNKTDYFYISPETLCNLGCETPRINSTKIGNKYRFFYAISSDVDAENPGTVIIRLRVKQRKIKLLKTPYQIFFKNVKQITRLLILVKLFKHTELKCTVCFINISYSSLNLCFKLKYYFVITPDNQNLVL